MHYEDFYFGMADAKTEHSKDPERFVRSFVDLENVAQLVRDREKFLVLGPKGTGKSALAWFLQATARDHDSVALTRDVSEMPITEVSKLKTGESAGLGRSLTAWKFIVLCGLLDVILHDQDSELNKDAEALDVIKKLREHGFLDPTPNRAILHASKVTIKIPIPKVGDIYSREKTESLHIDHLIPYLQKWVERERTPGRSHLLILDGLDSIYLNDAAYIPGISALVQATYLLNQSLQSHSSGAGVVILVRNDIFSRLDLPDGGKIRADWSVELDWRLLSGNSKDASLFDLVNRKAVSLTQSEIVRVVDSYFPTEVLLGRSYNNEVGRNIYEYLLNLTRHTPRDLLQLLEHIRKVYAKLPHSRKVPLISSEVLREGVLQYSTKYFVDAIRNELVGRGESGDDGRAAIDALRSMGSRFFTRGQFAAALADNEAPTSQDRNRADMMLRWLFFAGAIGNQVGTKDIRYLQFFHRRDDNDVYLKGTLVIHNALVYAWAIPWARQ